MLKHVGLEASLTLDDHPPGDAIDAIPENDTELTEDRMRRALGLGGSAASRTLTIKDATARPIASQAAASQTSSQRGRSAERISIRVDTALPLRQRVTDLEGQLAEERRRHEEARRLLHQAELTARALEARLQREAATQQDELEAARRAIVTAQRTLDDMQFEPQPRPRAGRSIKTDPQALDAPAAHVPARDTVARPKRSAAAAASSDSEPTLPKKRGRPRTRPQAEPKPVRWWTPSYRGKTKG